MLEYKGFDRLVANINGTVTENALAAILCDEFKEGLLTLCSAPLPTELASNAVSNPLVNLKTHVDDPPNYIKGEKKIALRLEGVVIRNAKPVWFRLQGKTVAMSGRCSITANCCGSDLRLPKDLLRRVGETVRLTYYIDLTKILKHVV
ncbi:MAG: hypothetical protein V3V31_07175 [Methylococcales bacterium]